jgi:Outer membrane protein
VDNRPELKQYEELRLAAKRAIVVQGATLQPKANLSGGVFGIGVGSGSLTPLYNLQFGVSMALGSLGTTDIANMQQAKWQARQAAIRAKQAFIDVFHEVRSSYDQSMAADKRIERASVQIKAAEEELRIATKRMQTGIGLNIDVLNAQRDLTQAGINKARALVDFNVAQVQMLRDIGLISAETVAAGVKL